MFSYSTEQTTHDLEGIKVGGQPGEFSTLMVGTLFYEDQFEEPRKALDKALELIEMQKDLSDRTSVPSMVDLFIYEEEEVEWKLDFALDNIEGFFSVDMPEAEVRMKVLEYLDQQGSLDRIIYNSMNLGMEVEELELLKDKTPAGAVLLGYNPHDNSTNGRKEMIEDGGALLEEGLLTIGEDIGIKYPLLDTAATSFGEKACEAIRAVPVFKTEFGLPVGCALHNTVESWRWLDGYEDKEDVFEFLDTAVDNLPVLLGADFIYYGPIENAPRSILNATLTDKLVAEGAQDYFGTEIYEEHPFHTLP
ncbi:MAG: hypothetical protein ACLFVL_01800 [Candidatus Aenigmatarchaeota archaeon]